jgi:hypothetical protein
VGARSWARSHDPLCWSDRYAGTIIKVGRCGTLRNDLLIWVREDCATRVDDNGIRADQVYKYSPTPHGWVWVFRLSKRGHWRPVEMDLKTGRWQAAKSRARSLRIGERASYHDYGV